MFQICVKFLIRSPFFRTGHRYYKDSDIRHIVQQHNSLLHINNQTNGNKHKTYLYSTIISLANPRSLTRTEPNEVNPNPVDPPDKCALCKISYTILHTVRRRRVQRQMHGEQNNTGPYTISLRVGGRVIISFVM